MENKECYSILKTILRVITLVVAIWALVIAYQAKNTVEWINDKQDNIIEKFRLGDEEPDFYKISTRCKWWNWQTQKTVM